MVCDTTQNHTECPEDHYCLQGMVKAVACPARSSAPSGSSSRGDCTCDPGYSGDLADPDMACTADSGSTHALTKSQIGLVAGGAVALLCLLGCLAVCLIKRFRKFNQILNESDITILNTLGAGNFGVTYHAKYKGLFVALKVPKGKSDMDELLANLEVG